MKRTAITFTVVIVGLWLIAQVPLVSAQDAAATMAPGASAEVMDKDGKQLGMVTFTDLEDGNTEVHAELSGLTPGFHAFHIHGMAMCDAMTEKPFTSAGGHLVLGDAKASHPEHNGDMPSLLVMADGSAKITFETDRFKVSDLLSETGTAVMIHAGTDNYGNIPERYGVADDATLGTGDAGGRVGCGVVSAMAGM